MEKKVNQSDVLRLKAYLLILFSLCGFTGLYAQESSSLKLTSHVTESYCAGTGHVISVNAEGGEAPYTFMWKDGKEGKFRKDLKSGTYTCTVRDSKGNKETKTFSFAPEPAALQLNFSQQKSDGGAYMVALEAKGGKAPYTYFWIGPGLNPRNSANKSSLENLSNGIYQVVVQDANGCTANNTITLK